MILRYAGIGIAMDTLIESTVRVTIRHNDSEPIASEAATASVSREEATGVGPLAKPAAPGNRLMARSFKAPANHLRIPKFRSDRWQDWGGAA
jgi:hypothetical protein